MTAVEDRATLSQLVDHILAGDNDTFVDDALLTMSFFTTPRIFADLLIDRGLSQCSEDGDATRLRVVAILERWVDINFNFRDDVALVDDILTALDGMKDIRAAGLEDMLTRVCHRLIFTEEDNNHVNFSPVSLKQHGRSAWWKTRYVELENTLQLLTLPESLLARQMTLIESEKFMRITPSECACARGCTFREDPSNAPNWNDLKRSFNKVSLWVASVIVQELSLSNRILIITKFIKIIEECRKLNNFTTVIAIIGGLDNSAVSRLKRTWAKVPQKAMRAFEDDKPLLSAEGNFATYRALLDEASPPIVPFLPYFEDMMFRTDVNNDTFVDNEKTIINFDGKCRPVAKLLRRMQEYQNVPYFIDPVLEIQQFFAAAEHLKQADLWKYSTQIEPAAAGIL